VDCGLNPEGIPKPNRTKKSTAAIPPHGFRVLYFIQRVNTRFAAKRTALGYLTGQVRPVEWSRLSMKPTLQTGFATLSKFSKSLANAVIFTASNSAFP
jgi:hypothetical protein